jgi:hypothetical protein
MEGDKESLKDMILLDQDGEKWIIPSNVIVVIDSSLTSDKAIEEKVCTFKYTKKRYSSQPWYLCKTCNIYCCVICRDQCHKDHELGDEENSDFFCDCGAENKACEAIK